MRHTYEASKIIKLSRSRYETLKHDVRDLTEEQSRRTYKAVQHALAVTHAVGTADSAYFFFNQIPSSFMQCSTLQFLIEPLRSTGLLSEFAYQYKLLLRDLFVQDMVLGKSHAY
jgi:hypothetical protein